MTDPSLRSLGSPESLIIELTGIGATVTTDDLTDQLVINDEYRASLVLTRCRQTPNGLSRWQINLDQKTPPDITILMRMDAENERPCDYYLLPRIDVSIQKLRLGERNGLYLDAYRLRRARSEN